LSYLYLAAYRDVLNFIEKEKKLSNFISSSEYEVEAAASEPNPEDLLLAQEPSLQERTSQLEQIVFSKFTDATDCELVKMMIRGVRETRAFARVLGIEDHPPEEQAIIVKRHKDRLKKVLQREAKKRIK
jgi:hypothetical protein